MHVSRVRQARSNSQTSNAASAAPLIQYLSFPVAYFNSNRLDAEQSRSAGPEHGRWSGADKASIASIKAADVGCRNQKWRRNIAIVHLGEHRRIGRRGRADRRRAGVRAHGLITAIRSGLTGNARTPAAGPRL